MSRFDAQASEAIAAIRHQIELLKNSPPDQLAEYIPTWKSRTIRILSKFIVGEELNTLNDISRDSWLVERDVLITRLSEIESGARAIPSFYLAAHSAPAKFKDSANDDLEPESPGTLTEPRRVFVVHGTDALSKIEVARTLEQLKLIPVILHEQPNGGKTIVEKLEQSASSVDFAIVLLTPDDVGAPAESPNQYRPRARQNVILELGFFSGLLGRKRICVLYRGELEIPSDFLGFVYIPLDSAGAWKLSMAKELRQANFPINLNLIA